jgi:hypothetical protein
LRCRPEGARRRWLRGEGAPGVSCAPASALGLAHGGLWWRGHYSKRRRWRRLRQSTAPAAEEGGETVRWVRGRVVMALGCTAQAEAARRRGTRRGLELELASTIASGRERTGTTRVRERGRKTEGEGSASFCRAQRQGGEHARPWEGHVVLGHTTRRTATKTGRP